MNIYTICNRPKLLKYVDKVVFKVNNIQYKYTVEDNFLSLCESEDNDKIFKVLNIKECGFCDKHYGYASRYDTIWPECKHNDYEALTRVVNALFDEINKISLPDNLFTLE